MKAKNVNKVNGMKCTFRTMRWYLASPLGDWKVKTHPKITSDSLIRQIFGNCVQIKPGFFTTLHLK